MRAFVIAFLVAAFISAILTPIVRRAALHIGAVSEPGRRHVHVQAIPRLGGIAIFVAFFTPIIALLFVESQVAVIARAEVNRSAALLVGGLVMCGLGVLDDARPVRSLHKFYVQIGVACLAYGGGFRIDAVRLPFLGDLSMGIFSIPVTIFWIVGIINAINLIDGLDGLAAGVVFFAALTNFTVAYLSNSTFVALLMASMLGAVIGFLFYNFNPARIFMGDSGSYFLGYVLATTSLVGSSQKASTAVSLLVPVLALGVPIFDTLFAMVRRYLERRPLFSPDRGHVHHRLLDMGITHRRAVMILYGVCVVFTIAAIGVSLGRSWQVGLALLGASVVFVGFVRFVGYFEYLHLMRRQKARLRSRHAELLRYFLPDLPALLADATTEHEIWAALNVVLSRADLQAVEIWESSVDKGSPIIRWEKDESRHSRGRELVSARYPVGREDIARCHACFTWESDYGDVSPQCEVLLQVIVDVVAVSLHRVGSDWSPRTSPAAKVTGSESRTSVTGNLQLPGSA